MTRLVKSAGSSSSCGAATDNFSTLKMLKRLVADKLQRKKSIDKTIVEGIDFNLDFNIVQVQHPNINEEIMSNIQEMKRLFGEDCFDWVNKQVDILHEFPSEEWIPRLKRRKSHEELGVECEGMKKQRPGEMEKRASRQ